MGPSLDKLNLLHIVHRYTGDGPTPASGKTRFLKELHLAVIVYNAIEKGIFRDYDWAPSLVEFHGVKMYGKVSQEAAADLRALQSETLVDKLHLSTCLYGTIRSYRSTARAAEALGSLPEESRASLDRLLDCGLCGALSEVQAFIERNGSEDPRNRTIGFCPRCCTVSRNGAGTSILGPAGARTEIAFFELTDVIYRSRPVLPVGFV
jgi:hypothetical protein